MEKVIDMRPVEEKYNTTVWVDEAEEVEKIRMHPETRTRTRQVRRPVKSIKKVNKCYQKW